MADDEKAVDPMAPHPSPVSTEGPSAAASPPPQSEWTASDERGPLGTAEDRPTSASGEPEEPATVAPEPAAAHDRENDPSPAAIEPAPADAAASAGSEPDRTEPAESSDADHDKRSFWPVAAGVIVGAVIGAGSAAAVYGLWSGATPPQDPQVASLAARVDALEKRPDAAGLTASVANLDQKVAALRSTAATRSNAPAASASSPPPAPTNLEPLQKEVAALQTQLESLKAQGSQTQDIDTKIAALEGAVAGTKKDASTAQAGVENVEGEQKSIATQQKLLADKVMVPALAVVADSLVQQIDRGEPYAAQVAALETLGADPAKIAVLKQNADRGVPSAKALAAKFAPLVEPISATAQKAPPNAGFVDRLKSGMFSMVSVRSVDDTAGTDPASRAAQINADLAHDDVAGALATWDTLTPDAKPKGGEDWSLLAKAHAEAMGAARGLQHDAIVALGAKKS